MGIKPATQELQDYPLSSGNEDPMVSAYYKIDR